MEIKNLNCSQLTIAHWEAWLHWHRDSDHLSSPFLHPNFTQAVNAVRNDVEVAVISDQGEHIGFVPYQRKTRSAAKPVGGRLSDYQAIIGRPDLSLCPKDLLRSCRLTVFDFDHLLTNQTPFQPYHSTVDDSPYLDLSEGFESYKEKLHKTGVSELKQTLRKERKMERELGPLRLEWMTNDPSMLEQLMSWKSDQYHATGVTDVFSFAWTGKLLHSLLNYNQQEFSGALSVLFAGDRPVATHMGMRSRDTLHWWFPTYNPQFSQYSPGRVLLAKLAQACPNESVGRIDLGRGMSSYKKRAMSGVITVAQGAVDLKPMRRAVREGWRTTRKWLKESPLHAPASGPAKLAKRLRNWVEFR